MTTRASTTLRNPYPEKSINAFPVVSSDEMREVDRLMIEEIGISLEQMMENAGLRLAEFTRKRFGAGCRVAILVGKGNNGGGGLVAARHLHNWGHPVCIILATPGHYFRETAIQQLRIVNNMQLPYLYAWDEDTVHQVQKELDESDVLIDTLIGYSLVGKPQDVYADLIERANAVSTPIIALDLPSGLHPDTGQCFEPYVRATATLTLAAPKAGLIKGVAATAIGELYAVDISVPDVVWEELGMRARKLFREGPIVKLKI